MAKKQLFGTDGIRTKANVYPLTPETSAIIGRAITRWFRAQKSTSPITAAIGTDTRISSQMLSFAVSSGIMSAGGNVIDLKVVPTPVVSDFVRTHGCDFGIVISASHNPFGDNGIKIFNENGSKLNDAQELEIEAIFFDDVNLEKPVDALIGRSFAASSPTSEYIERLRERFAALSGSGFKICVDCANGATAEVAKEIFSKFDNLNVDYNFCEPNGLNINDNCGALHPEVLAERVSGQKADIGFALDGDGDRLITIDELGRVVDGDKLIGILAKHLDRLGKLNKRTVAVTVMSNAGLEKHLGGCGIAIARTDVGDRYLFEKISAEGLSLAGENSGHIIIPEINPTGDGIIAALVLLEMLYTTGRKLSELADEIELFPQIQVKVKIAGEKVPLEKIPGLLEKIGDEEAALSGGRMLVRYSGTEPVMRIMAEGPDKIKVQKSVDEIAEFVKDFYGGNR
ncbi:phosphoglucosamine mutase [bacterium]|nr:phosphoglucosamine mutase [bacterium]